MKENINENKALSQTSVKCRFFAQYWMQDVKTSEKNQKKGLKPLQINAHSLQYVDSDSFLELKPLSKISNEDAIEVAKIFGMKEDLEFIGKILCTTMFDNSDSETETVLYNSNAKAVDYLRSKGYALPFMEYSVDDLISFGWVRLV
jgi:hypothetical protein